MRLDRRGSEDERKQDYIIKECCKEIQKKYSNIITLDLGDYDSIKKGSSNGAKYFANDGKMYFSKNRKRHICKDSKAIDGVAYFRNKENGNYLDLYFFCKYTKESGGNQDTIPFEIEITRNNIEKNNNENLSVIFILEGEYWKSSIVEQLGFDDKKTIYANRDNLQEVIIKNLKKHKII